MGCCLFNLPRLSWRNRLRICRICCDNRRCRCRLFLSDRNEWRLGDSFRDDVCTATDYYSSDEYRDEQRYLYESSLIFHVSRKPAGNAGVNITELHASRLAPMPLSGHDPTKSR